MLAGPLTTSPEQSSLHLSPSGAAISGAAATVGGGNQLHHQYTDEEEDEEEDDEREMDVSRLQFDFAADIDADIALDNSMRTDPRMNSYSYSVNASSHVLPGTADLAESQRLKRGGGRGGGGENLPWANSTASTAAVNGSKPATMTLKEQEKVIDQLKKESFSLKLKIFFLEERLAKVSPEHVDQALHENVEMKVKLQTMHSELKQFKRLLLEAHAAIEALQAQQKTCDLEHGMSEAEQKEFQQALQEAKELASILKNQSAQLHEMEEAVKANESEITALRDQVKGFERLQDQYEDRIQKLEEDLDESEKMIDEGRMWEERYRKLQQEAEEALAVKAHLEKNLADTEHQLQILKDNHDQELTMQSQDHRDEMARLNLMVGDLKAQLEDERAARMQVQDMHMNDMDALSEQWTQDRQEMREQNEALLAELDELRKENDMLAPQVQELLAWKNEDAMRHDQEMGDIVAELEEKMAEVDRLSAELDRYHALEEMLHLKDDRIIELEQQIDAMDVARKEADAVHDEVVARLKAKMQGGGHIIPSPGQPSPDVIIWREKFEQCKKDADELIIRLRETENRLVMEQNMAMGNQHWKEEKMQMEMQHADVVDDLQEQLATLSNRVAELTKALNDRENSVLHYEEQLAIASQQNKETRERYKDMELRLNSDLESTTAALTMLRGELEQLKSTQTEAGEQAAADFAAEMQNLEIKIRRQQEALTQLENEKQQLETSLRDRATTIAMLKSRVNELELQVAKTQRDEGENQATSSAMVERNSLLLTVLQHLENILGGDSRLEHNMLPKPSANFNYFSNYLLSRLKGLSKLFVMFEKRSKELEDRSLGQLNHLRKQFDAKLKQLEKFEGIVRTATDRQRRWREQLVKKTSENEALQAKNAQLTKVANEAKTRTTNNEKIHEFEARCKHAERKLQQEQSRHADNEERWNARLRELEKRTKDAEERVLRERQGAKEKVATLLDEKKTAQKSIEHLQKRNQQLQELVDIHKGNIQMSTSEMDEHMGRSGVSDYVNNGGVGGPGGGPGGGGSGPYHGSQTPGSMSRSRTNTELGLTRMNDQLREELEQQERMIEREREKVRATLRELEAVNSQRFKLQQQLTRHDSLFKNALGRIEMLGQRREVMENPGLRQATGELYRLLETEDGWN